METHYEYACVSAESLGASSPARDEFCTQHDTPQSQSRAVEHEAAAELPDPVWSFGAPQGAPPSQHVLRLPDRRFSHASAAAAGAVFVFGGFGSAYSHEMYRFDIDWHVWSAVPPPPRSRQQSRLHPSERSRASRQTTTEAADGGSPSSGVVSPSPVASARQESLVNNAAWSSNCGGACSSNGVVSAETPTADDQPNLAEPGAQSGTQSQSTGGACRGSVASPWARFHERSAAELYLPESNEYCWPAARYGHTLVSYGDRLYLYGGDAASGYLNDVWEYAPPEIFRRQLAETSCGFEESELCEFGMAASVSPWSRKQLTHRQSRTVERNHLGCVHHETEGSEAQDYLRHCLKYGQWTLKSTKGALPSGRAAHSACVWRHYMVIYGGWQGGDGFADVWLLDLKSFTWKQLHDEPKESIHRSRTDTRPLGGSSGRLHSEEAEPATESSQPSKQTNNSADGCSLGVSQISRRRSYHAGGFGGTGQFAGCDKPEARLWHTSGVYKDKMYIFGGYGSTGALGGGWRLNLAEARWEMVCATGEAPKPRCRHVGVVVGGHWFIQGGRDLLEGVFDDIYEFDFDRSHWSRVKSLAACSPLMLNYVLRCRSNVAEVRRKLMKTESGETWWEDAQRHGVFSGERNQHWNGPNTPAEAYHVIMNQNGEVTAGDEGSRGAAAAAAEMLSTNARFAGLSSSKTLPLATMLVEHPLKQLSCRKASNERCAFGKGARCPSSPIMRGRWLRPLGHLHERCSIPEDRGAQQAISLQTAEQSPKPGLLRIRAADSSEHLSGALGSPSTRGLSQTTGPCVAPHQNEQRQASHSSSISSSVSAAGLSTYSSSVLHGEHYTKDEKARWDEELKTVHPWFSPPEAWVSKSREKISPRMAEWRRHIAAAWFPPADVPELTVSETEVDASEFSYEKRRETNSSGENGVPQSSRPVAAQTKRTARYKAQRTSFSPNRVPEEGSHELPERVPGQEGENGGNRTVTLPFPKSRTETLMTWHCSHCHAKSFARSFESSRSDNIKSDDTVLDEKCDYLESNSCSLRNLELLPSEMQVTPRRLLLKDGQEYEQSTTQSSSRVPFNPVASASVSSSAESVCFGSSAVPKHDAARSPNEYEKFGIRIVPKCAGKDSESSASNSSPRSPASESTCHRKAPASSPKASLSANKRVTYQRLGIPLHCHTAVLEPRSGLIVMCGGCDATCSALHSTYVIHLRSRVAALLGRCLPCPICEKKELTFGAGKDVCRSCTCERRFLRKTGEFLRDNLNPLVYLVVQYL